MNWDQLDFMIDLFAEKYELNHLKIDSPLSVPKTRERLMLFTIPQGILFLKEFKFYFSSINSRYKFKQNRQRIK